MTMIPLEWKMGFFWIMVVLAALSLLPLLEEELPVNVEIAAGIATGLGGAFFLFVTWFFSHNAFQERQKRRWEKLARRWTATGRPDNLREADFWDTDLSGVDLGAPKEADKGANLARVGLRRSNLAGANLSAANLTVADLEASNLASANLSAANLRGVNLIAANLRGANLRDADLRDADLGQASLVDADLRGAKLENCSLSRAVYDNTTRWPEGLRPPSLAGANLGDSSLTGANLSAANLRGASLWLARLENANLRNADLREASLRGAWLMGADLRGAKLEGCSLSRTIYDNATRWPEGFNPPSEAVNADAEGNEHVLQTAAVVYIMLKEAESLVGR